MKLRALDKRKITKEQFINICNSRSTIEAMFKTGLNKSTFIKYAKYLKCYHPNQGGGGKPKNIGPHKFSLDKWNKNQLIEISRVALKKWIFKYKLLTLKCNNCNEKTWLNKPIPLELNHINGNGHDHKKSNLELLCPNCHALTSTYRGKNIKK